MSNVPLERELEAQFEGIKQGDQISMKRFYLAMYSRLYAQAVSRVGVLDAEEVINDTMLVVWKDAKKFNGDSKIATWIFGIVKNQCLKKLQKASAKKRSSVTLVDSHELESVSAENSMEASLITLHEIEKVLSVLSVKQFRALRLIVEGRSYQEIAEIEGCPESTAKTRVCIARKLCKEKHEELNSKSSEGI